MRSFADIKFKFGIHKGKPIKDVPDEYLKFLLSKNILKGKLLQYCQEKFNMPKTKFTVTVKDAIVGDGIYTIEAYNKHHAMKLCIRQNNIQCAQGFCGTSFDIQTN